MICKNHCGGGERTLSKISFHMLKMTSVKFLPVGSPDTFDRLYEAAELQVLRESRIVITTCTNASLLNLRR
jgi:hypothetical protein